MFCDPPINQNGVPAVKTSLKSLLLLAAIGMMTHTTVYGGSAFDQLNDAARDGDAATSEPTDEGAREGAGQGWDTDSGTPVDLTGHQGIVDPNDLKQYDPPQDNGGPIE